MSEAIGKALAFYGLGDLRDWPRECPFCQSRDLHDELYGQDKVTCGDCRREITNEMVYVRQREIAQADIAGQPKPRPWL